MINVRVINFTAEWAHTKLVSMLSYSVLLICWHFAWNHILQFSHSTPLELAVTRYSQFWKVLICVLSLRLGVCNFNCGSTISSKSLPKSLPRIIAKPSFWQYQISLHLKSTFVTANSSRRFIVVLGLLSDLALNWHRTSVCSLHEQSDDQIIFFQIQL